MHSVKVRLKDPKHLYEKLVRNRIKYPKKPLVTSRNLFLRINDIVGIRILHLHTEQIKDINTALLQLFSENNYRRREGPEARVWDDEYRQYYRSINMPHKTSPGSQYMSVHYVIEPNRRERLTCEIQVRTLAEELWGEVDHRINYPKKTKILACKGQIAVLARLTSGCTRLVDSIFKSYFDES